MKTLFRLENKTWSNYKNVNLLQRFSNFSRLHPNNIFPLFGFDTNWSKFSFTTLPDLPIIPRTQYTPLWDSLIFWKQKIFKKMTREILKCHSPRRNLRQKSLSIYSIAWIPCSATGDLCPITHRSYWLNLGTTTLNYCYPQVQVLLAQNYNYNTNHCYSQVQDQFIFISWLMSD